jgi:hypothetical protein
MSKIMISELTETTSAPDSSFIAIDNGTTTNKITVANYNSNANATAKSYAEAAQGYASDALSAKNDAVSAKTDTQTLVGNASDYANAASTSASSAAGSASEASGYVGAAQTSASNAAASARAAASSAAGVEDQVKLAKSWAVGNTGVRSGEATNNAMYWAGQAAAAAGGGVVSFNGRTGTVLPDSGDYSASQITHGESDVATDLEALATNKLDTYASDSTQWDSAPTDSSTKPVTSGGLYAEMAKKQPTYAGDSTAWDSTPTVSSNNPVTSDGIKTALDNKENKFTILDETLAAGSTQVTFTNAAITANCDVWIRTNKPGLNWIDINDSTAGTIIITYPAQTSPVGVRLIIRG